MSDITKAVAARQAQITQLQSDIETLQRAASLVSRTATTAKATSQPNAKPKVRRKPRKPRAAATGALGQPKTTQKRKRPKMSAAAKKAVSKRMKAYWAKRRKAKG